MNKGLSWRRHNLSLSYNGKVAALSGMRSSHGLGFTFIFVFSHCTDNFCFESKSGQKREFEKLKRFESNPRISGWKSEYTKNSCIKQQPSRELRAVVVIPIWDSQLLTKHGYSWSTLKQFERYVTYRMSGKNRSSTSTWVKSLDSWSEYKSLTIKSISKKIEIKWDWIWHDRNLQ